MLSERENEQIMALYNQGLNDREIGAAIFRDRASVGKWRRLRGLPPNCPQGYPHKILMDIIEQKTAEQNRIKMELYKRGYNDREIGEAIGMTGGAITYWRRKRGLKRNG